MHVNVESVFFFSLSFIKKKKQQAHFKQYQNVQIKLFHYQTKSISFVQNEPENEVNGFYFAKNLSPPAKVMVTKSDIK